MKAILLTLLMIGSLTFLLLLVIGRQKIFQHPQLLVFFFLIYFMDNLSITLTNLFPSLQIIPNHLWGGFLICSWSGKAYSLLIVLILLFAFRSIIPMKSVGISIQQNGGSLIPSVGIIFFIAIWSSLSAFNLPKGDLDTPTLAYLAIMPGLNEELVYRGALPACLNRLFPKKWILASAEIGWSTVITTALFGLLHGLWLDNQVELYIELVLIRNALLSGFIFAWLKERTGSLLMPIIAHGVWDFFFFFFRMI